MLLGAIALEGRKDVVDLPAVGHQNRPFLIGFKPEGVLRPVRHWSKETRNTLGWFASWATDALRQLDAPDGCS